MKTIRTLAFAGALASLFAGAASAAEIERLYGPNAMSPIASAVSVPPGYTTFYVSGALPSPMSAMYTVELSPAKSISTAMSVAPAEMLLSIRSATALTKS